MVKGDKTEKKKPSLPRILVVDDELPIRRFLRAALSGREFFLYDAENGYSGLAATTAIRPDVILLDLGLPDLNGLEFIKRFREWSQTPIIALSEIDREDEKVNALDAGADDCITKPFGVAELLARIRAVLRRSLRPPPEPAFSCGSMVIDFDHRRVFIGSKEVHLTPIEYNILQLLTVHADKVLTHNQFLMHIWGNTDPEHAHALRVNICNLRHKIEADTSRPQHIITETGVGYRLKTNN